MIESALPSSFRRWRYKKIWYLVIICLATLNITACDYINSKLYPDFKANDIKTPVDKPPFARKNAAPKISIEKIRDIANAETKNDSDFTVNPIALNNEIADPKGVNTNQLFAEPVKTDEERFARIEARVQKISDALNKMAPAITRLIGIESELDNLTFQLEELINKGKLDGLVNENNHMKAEAKEKTTKALPTPSKPTSVKPTPVAKAPPTSPKTAQTKKPTPPKAMASGALIHKLRLGDHPDKTRIVFETTEKLDYSVAVDNKEKIMTVTFPTGNLPSSPTAIARQSNIIKSISQNIKGDGSIIAFELTQTAQKPKQFRIPPSAELSRHRIVIDLKR